MSNAPKALVPFAHVKSVSASIAFYEKLGFTVGNTVVPAGETEPVWAWMQSGGAQIMLGRADGPFDADQQAVLFYIYVDDLPAKHAALKAAGIGVGEIQLRFYAPRGEFRVHDPDDYVLMFMHT